MVTADGSLVTAEDTIDQTTVLLGDVTQDEGLNATITATIDHAPTDEPLVLTLSNGATITFGIGDLTATSTAFLVQSEDVYLDAGSYTVGVASYSGGEEFENLVTADGSLVTAEDTIDQTTVLLGDVTQDEGLNATITATIDHAPTDEPLVLTLSNGATITFGIGDLTATSTAFLVQSEDVYLDAGSYTVGVASYSGGEEFENLVTADGSLVTAEDTIDQ